MKIHDAIVIGAGPAGIQASIYIKRANFDPLVIAKDLGVSVQSQQVDNYYAVFGIPGQKLAEKGLEHANYLGIDVLEDEVMSIEKDQFFKVLTKNHVYYAETVLIATGAHRNTPRIRKIRNYEGKGVSYCAVCDAFFYRNKRVAVLGSQAYALHEAGILSGVTDELMILSNGKELDFDNCPYEIDTRRIKSLYGDGRLQGVEFRDGSTMDFDALFVALDSPSSLDLAKKLGLETEGGKIKVNRELETNIEGLYAAGDAVMGVEQIAKAVGEGCVAGMNMAGFIRNKRRKVK